MTGVDTPPAADTTDVSRGRTRRGRTRRTNHDNIHVRGYKEEGTTTTPFDMVMMNHLDRDHLVMDVIDRVPSLVPHAAALRQEMGDKRLLARARTRDHGEDLPEVRDWSWAKHSRTGTRRRRRLPRRPTSPSSGNPGPSPRSRGLWTLIARTSQT